MTEAIILDTETTDKEEGMEVIELAWESFGGEFNGCHRFEPSNGIKWGAMGVHHILPSEVIGQNLEPSRNAYKLLQSGLKYIIGHNIDFDWKALGCLPIKRICTLAMARSLWPECDSHSLSALTYFTQGPTETTRNKLRSAHSAAADVRLCAELLQTIMTVAKITDLDALYQFSEDARIPKTMTFGKHKGKKIAEVDRGYSNWYRKQPDTDPYLLEAFRRAGI